MLSQKSSASAEEKEAYFLNDNAFAIGYKLRVRALLPYFQRGKCLLVLDEQQIYT